MMSRAGKWVVFASVLAAAAIPCLAQQDDRLPAVFDGVGIVERLGDTVALDLPFANAAGDSVTIAELVPDGQPILLNFVYHTCPMLCSILLDQLVDGLQGLDRAPGDRFQVVTVSMAAFETSDLAKKQKDRYLALLDRPEAEAGWHFLTGPESSVNALAESVGFGFKWVDETDEYAHAAALIFLSSDGTITRYLHGINYPAADLDKALREASSGKIASVIDRLVLYCYQYDPSTNSYVVQASNLMKLGGFATVCVLAVFLFVLWRRESAGRGMRLEPS